ncbi:MFS transporter [Rhodococcus sp. BP-252]|uniref:MFS transporter n=1 Tax=Rhodococcoides kyotonense TaxID=398843 RepID=A0A177YAN7_9NOCA|nr:MULTISPECIES: MFS transporter [Rhodococcus]MBY6413512.1 MFS transporter [Rhodococcus sp. BP-320]MBY6418292.1 MFS transporter [Rhodococcus sp. BP-321]MBY6422706.1 MFS transporter [Rhodococcus sp. BP-324]MBY6428237.1 MFS transporter [Rhodococcus sp. BP-323]MBY6433414.1 MFS transporter [Rhodococcus sp. BP-322]
MFTVKTVWVVWGVGVFAYIVAILHRTAFGVAGLEAASRFSINPAVLSSFVVLQVVVYAAMQIPAGLLLDRVGSRKMIALGALLMTTAQVMLAVTESLPVAVAARALVGIGDALTFISVLRLVPRWFPPRQVPIVSQLTGLIGQSGQILSAVPFLILLQGPGWTFAFGSAASLGLLAFVLALSLIRDTPAGADVVESTTSLRETFGSIGQVWKRPGTRLGFFSHMGTQFSITVFALLWGIPYLTSGQGLSASTAGGLLSISVVSSVFSGICLGILTGRYPMRRSWLVLAVMVSNAAMWGIVLALPGPAPLWLLVLLVVVISVGGPGSMIGFDYARTFNPSANLGTAQGMVNIGGFTASLLVIAAIGWILQALGGYTFDAFRVAFLAQYPVWIVAIVGVLLTRRKTRRQLADEGIYPHTMREVIQRVRDR